MTERKEHVHVEYMNAYVPGAAAVPLECPDCQEREAELARLRSERDEARRYLDGVVEGRQMVIDEADATIARLRAELAERWCKAAWLAAVKDAKDKSKEC